MASKLAFCCGGLLTALLCTGCANTYRAPLKPPCGAFLTTQTFPITLDFPAEGIPVAGLRKVSSESGYFFWPYPLFDLAWGDPRALGKAAHSGRLGRVAYAEAEVLTVFGFFGRYAVNVYGLEVVE